MEKMITRHSLAVIGGVIALWGAVFAFMVLPQEIRFVSDNYPRVILETEPVDPFDLLRGEYVILSYPALQPDESDLENLGIGDHLYASLQLTPENHVSMVEFTAKKPESGLYLRGKVQPHRWRNEKTVIYGLESYFVPQGEGRELEQLRNESILDVEVAVNPKTGRATIMNLFVGDQPLDGSDEAENALLEADEIRRFQFHANDRYQTPEGKIINVSEYDYFKPFSNFGRGLSDTLADTESGFEFLIDLSGETATLKRNGTIIEVISFHEFFEKFLSAEPYAEDHISDIDPAKMRFEHTGAAGKVVLDLDLVEFVETRDTTDSSLMFHDVPVQIERMGGDIFIQLDSN